MASISMWKIRNSATFSNYQDHTKRLQVKIVRSLNVVTGHVCTRSNETKRQLNIEIVFRVSKCRLKKTPAHSRYRLRYGNRALAAVWG